MIGKTVRLTDLVSHALPDRRSAIPRAPATSLDELDVPLRSPLSESKRVGTERRDEPVQDFVHGRTDPR